MVRAKEVVARIDREREEFAKDFKAPAEKVQKRVLACKDIDALRTAIEEKQLTSVDIVGTYIHQTLTTGVELNAITE